MKDSKVVKNYINKPVVVKDVLKKKAQSTLELNRPSPILSKIQKDSSRFFKDEMEDERSSLFSS